LPHNRLGRAMFKKLKVYPGNEHPHQAQTPVSHAGEAKGAE
jgi:large subunit ribosomal protein L13